MNVTAWVSRGLRWLAAMTVAALLAACGVALKPGQTVDGFDQTKALSGGAAARSRISASAAEFS